MTRTVAAHTFALLTAVVVIFQIALAAGAPWGAYTWAGRFTGRLPRLMHGVAAGSAVLLLSFGMLVEIRAGIIWPAWHALSRSLIWIVVGYCALGVVANAASPSRGERMLWLPVVTIMLACSLVVATSAPAP